MKIKKALIAVLAVTGVIGGMYSNSVMALPDHARIVTYYSDASMTDVVGEGGNGCQHSFMWGTKTEYYTIETFDCF